jgi:hypothetical protein
METLRNEQLFPLERDAIKKALNQGVPMAQTSHHRVLILSRIGDTYKIALTNLKYGHVQKIMYRAH